MVCIVTWHKTNSRVCLSCVCRFTSSLWLPVPLVLHHSTEERCLGDCALGEGMCPQSVTNGENLFGDWALPVMITHSAFLFTSLVPAVVCWKRVSHTIKCTHTVCDLSSLQPLINPAFPCGRSLRRRCWRKENESFPSPLIMKQFYYCGWNHPVLHLKAEGVEK